MRSQDVLALVQAILNDPNEERWTAANTPPECPSGLYDRINRAQNKALAIRPDLLKQADGTQKTVTAADKEDVIMTLPDLYLEELAYYVANTALLEDNADTANMEKAELYRQRFYKGLMTGGM